MREREIDRDRERAQERERARKLRYPQSLPDSASVCCSLGPLNFGQMPSDKMLHIQGELSKSREAITTCSSPTAAGSSKRQHDNTRNEYNTDSKQQSVARRARIIAIAVPNPFCSCLLQPRAPLSTLASGTSEGTARGSLLTWGFRLSHTGSNYL